MKESETKATAVISMTVKVHLTQPWSGECTLNQIQIQAKRDAEEHIQMCLAALAKENITLGKITSIQVILNREDV